jgi:hypothetical protein
MASRASPWEAYDTPHFGFSLAQQMDFEHVA